MASKGKLDPKAAAKGSKSEAKPGAKPPAPPGTLTREQIVMYLFSAGVAVLSILVIIVMTILFDWDGHKRALLKPHSPVPVLIALDVTLHEVGSPVDYPMRRLKSTLVETIDDPHVQTGGPMRLANAVNNLPNDFQDAEDDYENKKRKYQSLFQKAMRSSSGPWKLHGKSLYYFVKGEKTWYDAENFCISRDAHLASVLNDEEQDFISSQIEQPSWIGLSDVNKEGVWRWIDGSTLQKQYWSYDEPSNEQRGGEPGRNCALAVPSSNNHNWKDDNCHKLYGWVCQEKLDSE